MLFSRGDYAIYEPMTDRHPPHDLAWAYKGSRVTVIETDWVNLRCLVAFGNFPYCVNREQKNRFWIDCEELAVYKDLGDNIRFINPWDYENEKFFEEQQAYKIRGEKVGTSRVKTAEKAR